MKKDGDSAGPVSYFRLRFPLPAQKKLDRGYATMLVFTITPGGVPGLKLSRLAGLFNARKLLNLMNHISCGLAGKTKKNTFFRKRTGEVIDNKQSATKNKAEQTEKQSGEVVENTFLWKKQTQNKPKTKLPILLKIKES